MTPLLSRWPFGGEAKHQQIQNRQYRDKQHDPMGLRLDQLHQPLRIRDEIRLSAIRFVAQISQNGTPKGRAHDGNNAKHPEIHPNNPGRNRNQMANYREETRKENAARFVALQPDFSALQFVGCDEEKSSETLDHRPSDRA